MTAGEWRFDRFLIGGAPAGALVRHLTAGSLRTVIVFAEPGGQLVHHTSEIYYEGEPERWTATTYFEAEHGLLRTETNPSLKPGSGPDHATASVPSYADVLVVERLARAMAPTEYAVLVLHERDGDLSPGRYRLHTTDLQTPRGLQADVRVDVTTGVQLHSRHWCRRGTLLASDWMGAFSFRVATLEAALAGAPPQVRSTLNTDLNTDLAAGPGTPARPASNLARPSGS